MPSSAPSVSRSLTGLLRRPLLDHYVIRQMLIALAAMTGGAVALIWLMQSLKFVSLVVQRGLSLRTFLGLTSLLAPGFVAIILPITTFLVILFTCQRLVTDREMTVMRAAGLSPLQISRPALIVALFSTLLCYILNIWIVPTTYHAFHRYEFQIRNRMAAFMLQDGVFTTIPPNMTVYIRKRDSDGELHGVLVEDDRDPDAHTTILAEHGSIVVVNGQPRVVLNNGSRQVIDHKTGRLNVLSFKRNTVDLVSGKNGDRQERDPAEMSIRELLHPDLDEVPVRDRGKFAVEAWRRLTSPLTAFSFSMIGLFAAVGGVFSRHGNFTRPFGAVMSVVGLLAFSLMLQNLAGRNLRLVPLMWLISIVPALICAFLLFRDEIRERWSDRGRSMERS
ncbi:LPS export ABC transporter permease LptF [Brytella acorum]|uniref:LPS export ABC transporter permease LptF n=1 Tax=Brytella acorum TaxID=2959299 RepID=A0AA35UHD4_9PROT|nr:LPS export ABC transporter permease LptF [Brytella acorum]MDF3623496.1 LPS export ABC transporter permease LptF [Brytella acorum]CAI9121371.1 LPS export ABC transporter permease LptF [Brytella acorum]